MNQTILKGIDELLTGDWQDIFTFDRDIAKTKGVIVLCYKATNIPIPLNVEISEEASEKERLNWREIHRKVRECLPDYVMKNRISEANAILRNADRRIFKDVERDFKKWLQETSTTVEQVYGRDFSKKFLEEVSVPKEIRPTSIQAIQYLFKEKIDYLKRL